MKVQLANEGTEKDSRTTHFTSEEELPIKNR
jgi:hypothetical protein